MQDKKRVTKERAKRAQFIRNNRYYSIEHVAEKLRARGLHLTMRTTGKTWEVELDSWGAFGRTHTREAKTLSGAFRGCLKDWAKSPRITDTGPKE